MVTVEKADVLFASGRSRAYPVAVDFDNAAYADFNLDDKLGLTVERRFGQLKGGGQSVDWRGDTLKTQTGWYTDGSPSYDYLSVCGCSVLLPMAEMLAEADPVVSVTTSTGSSWVLVGNDEKGYRYETMETMGGGPAAQTGYLGAGGFGSLGGAAGDGSPQETREKAAPATTEERGEASAADAAAVRAVLDYMGL